MDLTNSPTIWALGSIVRLPWRMRWPSRKRSASSSLIAVCDNSKVGWLMTAPSCPGGGTRRRPSRGCRASRRAARGLGPPGPRRAIRKIPAGRGATLNSCRGRVRRSREPQVWQRVAAAERIGRIDAVLEHAGDPRLAGDGGDDALASAHRGLAHDPGLEPRADDRLVDEPLTRYLLPPPVQH